MATDKPVGHLLDGTGHEITIDDLWGLIPGGTNAGTSTGNSGGFGTLYFTAGTDNGTHGDRERNAAPGRHDGTGRALDNDLI